MRHEKDLYRILGISPHARKGAIRRAWRAAARNFHPDLHGDKFLVEFNQARTAYEILSDPEKRAEYDLTGSTEFVEGVSVPVRDIVFAVFAEVLGQNIHATHVDYASATHHRLQQDLQKVRGELQRALPHYKRLVQIRPHLRIDGVPGGILRDFATQEIAQGKNIIRSLIHRSKLLRRAIDLAARMSYTGTQQNPPPSAVNMSFVLRGTLPFSSINTTTI